MKALIITKATNLLTPLVVAKVISNAEVIKNTLENFKENLPPPKEPKILRNM
jgi:hypothetical protein